MRKINFRYYYGINNDFTLFNGDILQIARFILAKAAEQIKSIKTPDWSKPQLVRFTLKDLKMVYNSLSRDETREMIFNTMRVLGFCEEEYGDDNYEYNDDGEYGTRNIFLWLDVKDDEDGSCKMSISPFINCNDIEICVAELIAFIVMYDSCDINGDVTISVDVQRKIKA